METPYFCSEYPLHLFSRLSLKTPSVSTLSDKLNRREPFGPRRQSGVIVVTHSEVRRGIVGRSVPIL